MQYEISLQNRLKIGFALGFSYYGVDEEFDYGEFILYLGLLSLHFKYQRLWLVQRTEWRETLKKAKMVLQESNKQ